jgi:hypothetical protein
MQYFFSFLSWRLFTAQHVSGFFPPIIRSSMIEVAASGCVRGRAGRPARPRTQHNCHHDTKVKPEAATSVIELLMMDGKTPETCWAVNKRQDKKLKNYCIWVVIYWNCTMTHGLTYFKFKNFKIGVKYSLLLLTWQDNFSYSNPKGIIWHFIEFYLKKSTAKYITEFFFFSHLGYTL